MSNWFRTSSINASAAEIIIYDEVGRGGVTAEGFRDALKALGPVSRMTVSINSPGGGVFEGFAIANLIKSHPAHVTVRIDGVAASIASYIAMAGDEVLMPANAMMMIHDPSALVVGTARDMVGAAAMLEKVKLGMVAAYSAKSKKSPAEVALIMTDETWFTAQEAVASGFADRVEEPVKIAANFDLTKFATHQPPTTIAEMADRYWAKQPGPRAAAQTRFVNVVPPAQPAVVVSGNQRLGGR